MSTDTVSLTLRGQKETCSVGELCKILEDIEMLVLCSSVSVAESSSRLSPSLEKVREILTYPPGEGPDTWFWRFLSPQMDRVWPLPEGMDPTSAIAWFMLRGSCVWLREKLLATSDDLHEEIMSIARVERMERRSPFELDIVVLMGVAVGLPSIVLGGIFFAIARVKRMLAEASIRENDAKITDEKLTQERARTEILKTIRDGVVQQAANGGIEISDEILVAITQMSAPAVSDLASSPIIGNIGVSYSQES